MLPVELPMCRNGKCCPTIQALPNPDTGDHMLFTISHENKSVLLSKQNFKDFVANAKEGNYDKYLK